jgi:O-antigen/teichoic acid export membrane protein
MQLSQEESDAAAHGATRKIIFRNTFYLAASQVLTIPLAILINAMVAHYLGAEILGYAYLASTLSTFGFLAVGWGHEAVLPAVVARDHSLAGTMLGSSVAWRIATSVVVYVILAFGCYVLGYPTELQWALGLTCLLFVGTYLVAAFKDTIRGLERTDIPAAVHVGQQILATVFVLVVLLLGGKLRAVLLAQVVVCGIALLLLWPMLRSIGVGTLSVRWTTIKTLFSMGTPFVMFGIAMALQPNIDAIYLSKLAPIEVMGWYAVSRRLIGALILPASTLIGALYPTLCRLHATDAGQFRRTTNDALRSVSLLAIPAALGCGLYPEIGVALFSRASFRPAEDNLRIMAVLVALVYFTMPLGTAIMAAGRQRAWSLVQCLCVLTSLVLDPLLVPIFQSRTGNGGLGLSVAAVISEAIVIGCGVALIPRGVFDRKLVRVIMLSLVSGAAMMITARIARPLTPFLGAPLSLLAYAGALWLTGGVDDNQVMTIRRTLGRGLSRLVPSARSRRP